MNKRFVFLCIFSVTFFGCNDKSENEDPFPPLRKITVTFTGEGYIRDARCSVWYVVLSSEGGAKYEDFVIEPRGEFSHQFTVHATVGTYFGFSSTINAYSFDKLDSISIRGVFSSETGQRVELYGEDHATNLYENVEADIYIQGILVE